MTYLAGVASGIAACWLGFWLIAIWPFLSATLDELYLKIRRLFSTKL